MWTNLITYILKSERRKAVFLTLLEYPNRQWSCTAVEETAKMTHATVFRTLNELVRFGVLKTLKPGKKIILFELVKGPLVSQIEKLLHAERDELVVIAKEFVAQINSRDITSCVLFGSVAKGKVTTDSDIDVLVLTRRADKKLEREIFDKAADISVDFNRTVSPTVMQEKEFRELVRKKDPFALSILNDMVLLYGKEPS
jgi:predicted nucleotidyltransferase